MILARRPDKSRWFNWPSYHLTVICPFHPFNPKRDHMTFLSPWAKVEILEYEMQRRTLTDFNPWNLTRIWSRIWQNLESLKSPGGFTHPPPPTFYRFLIPTLIWYLSYWCLICSHRLSHSRWDLNQTERNQTTFHNRIISIHGKALQERFTLGLLGVIWSFYYWEMLFTKSHSEQQRCAMLTTIEQCCSELYNLTMLNVQ